MQDVEVLCALKARPKLVGSGVMRTALLEGGISTLAAVLLRQSATGAEKTTRYHDVHFDPAHAVIVTIALKTAVTGLLAAYSARRGVRKLRRSSDASLSERKSLKREAASSFPIALLLLPGAFLVAYELLKYEVAMTIEVPASQLSASLQIPCTALATIFLGGRWPSVKKALAMAAMTAGVWIAFSGFALEEQMRMYKGLSAAVLACFMNAVAITLHDTLSPSSEARNPVLRDLQLSIFTLVPALALAASTATSTFTSFPSFAHFFAGFSARVWVTIVVQATLGATASLAMRENANQAVSMASSMVLSSLVGVLFFGFKLSPRFLVGMGTVIVPLFLFHQSTHPSSSSRLLHISLPALHTKNLDFVEAPASDAPVSYSLDTTTTSSSSPPMYELSSVGGFLTPPTTPKRRSSNESSPLSQFVFTPLDHDHEHAQPNRGMSASPPSMMMWDTSAPKEEGNTYFPSSSSSSTSFVTPPNTPPNHQRERGRRVVAGLGEPGTPDVNLGRFEDGPGVRRGHAYQASESWIPLGRGAPGEEGDQMV